ncbi:hypothetical protein V144x_23470 [Gimesia aquarii]|uniref:Uncharacterized protein n=1 Tax=Gimesia aquarii TaxID=2527964 RepID=A0A517VV50_9PLAN|nr:hypothetical protein V144x_23470 [Gimesia aquarii]
MREITISQVGKSKVISEENNAYYMMKFGSTLNIRTFIG